MQHTNFQSNMTLVRTTSYMDYLVKTGIKNTMVLVRIGYMDRLEDRHKENHGTG
jgi:hypothetical protein